MTSPIETNNVVERLDALADRQRRERGDVMYLGEHDPEISEATDLIQSLSDRIDVLEGENARLRRAPAYGETTAGTATKLRTRRRASLTQGGNTNG